MLCPTRTTWRDGGRNPEPVFNVALGIEAQG